MKIIYNDTFIISSVSFSNEKQKFQSPIEKYLTLKSEKDINKCMR